MLNIPPDNFSGWGALVVVDDCCIEAEKLNVGADDVVDVLFPKIPPEPPRESPPGFCVCKEPPPKIGIDFCCDGS